MQCILSLACHTLESILTSARVAEVLFDGALGLVIEHGKQVQDAVTINLANLVMRNIDDL